MHKLLLGLLLVTGADYSFAQTSKEPNTENVKPIFQTREMAQHWTFQRR
jgi:hypothetical protein